METCPICSAGGPRDPLARLEAGVLVFPEDGPVRGYAALFARRHAVELHDLSEGEAAAFMRDLRLVSRALSDVTGARKLNLELHGNTIPHLHVHFFPRYPGDRFEGRPVDPREVSAPVYAPGEHQRLARALRSALGERDGGS